MQKVLPKKVVENLFLQHTDQSDLLTAMYQEVFPNWESITEIHNNPSVSRNTWIHITLKFIEFDRKLGVENPGFYWLKYGFNYSSKELKDWTVDLSECEVIR